MVFSSRKNKKGGDKIEDIQFQLNRLQSEVDELKKTGSVSDKESVSDKDVVSDTDAFSLENDAVSEPEPEMVKSWVDDKTIKFKDGKNGRVTLSFNRIMTLLDNNIKKSDTGKDWSTIKEKLSDAKSTDGVQDVINQYEVSFSSNYVAGTRRKRRHNKKRTSRKH
jgi:hypothetical protein